MHWCRQRYNRPRLKKRCRQEYRQQTSNHRGSSKVNSTNIRTRADRSTPSTSRSRGGGRRTRARCKYNCKYSCKQKPEQSKHKQWFSRRAGTQAIARAPVGSEPAQAPARVWAGGPRTQAQLQVQTRAQTTRAQGQARVRVPNQRSSRPGTSWSTTPPKLTERH